MLVPTVDTIRYTWLLDTLVKAGKQPLFVGPTGTGKSRMLEAWLHQLPAAEWSPPVVINCTARTSADQVRAATRVCMASWRTCADPAPPRSCANPVPVIRVFQLRETLDNALIKHQDSTTGRYGPAMGTRAVFFIDDVNLPSMDMYGAIPSVELLRQWMGQGGWYAKPGYFKRVVDLIGICAMGPRGGGRNQLTPRFTRHLNAIACVPFTDAVLQQIFESILKTSLQQRGLSQAFVELSTAVVAATVGAYNEMVQNMLPTPYKSHYTFNLRDVAKVVQGIALADASTFKEPSDLMLLWAHEVLRVFYDRLVEDSDRSWLLDRIRALCRMHFAISIDELMAPFDANGNQTFDDEDVGLLLFLPQPDPAGGPAAPYTYQHVRDLEAINATLSRRLADYNRTSPVAMHLVLFPFAVEHICRISRVLFMPAGHALLVGLQGSGRQSLTRLSAYYLGLSVFRASEVKAGGSLETWKEDMKSLLRQASMQARTTVFLMSDTEMVDEGQMEDLSGLLIRGEVPNLFGADEMVRIVEQLPRKHSADQALIPSGAISGAISDLAARELFAERCRARVHVILAMSPIGDKTRQQFRKFPALVNSSMLIWFRDWPVDALKAVATSLLKDDLLSSNGASRPKRQPTDDAAAAYGDETTVEERRLQEHARSAFAICGLVHQSAQQLCEWYGRMTGRTVYVMPSSFTGLVDTYRRLLRQQRKEISRNQKRYRTGLRQLEAADARISDLRQDLIEQRKMIDEQKNTQLLRTHETLKDEVQSVWKKKYEKCEAQIRVGQKLIDDLSDEKVRWEAALRALGPRYDGLLGDMLLAAAFVTYLGPLTTDARQQAIEQWQQLCVSRELPMVSTSSFSLADLLTDPVKLRSWSLQGLPADDFAVDNGVVVSVTGRWPFLIDPQSTAQKWVTTMETKGEHAREGASGLVVVRLAQPDLIDKLQFAVHIGQAVLVESMGESIDPILAPLVSKRYFKKGGIEHVQLGEKAVEVHKHFRLFLQTKLPNPRLSAELQACLTMLIFMITPTSLEEQLLGTLIAKELPDLSSRHEKFMSELSSHEQQLKVKEDNILDSLATSEGGSILEDTTAVTRLTEAKALWSEIGAARGEAQHAEAQIRQLRGTYRPAAAFATTLFFCILELHELDHMYAYSLEWFADLFCASIASTQQAYGTGAADVSSWSTALKTHLQLQVFRKVSHGIFMKHRPVFALQLCRSILTYDGSLDPLEWRYLVTQGALAESVAAPNPAPDWLPDKAWGTIARLSQLPFAQECDFFSHFATNAAAYRPFYDHAEPFAAYNLLPKPPSEWTPFRKLLLLIALRFDKLVPAVGALMTQLSEFGPLFSVDTTSNTVRVAALRSLNHFGRASPQGMLSSPGLRPQAPRLSAGYDQERVRRLVCHNTGHYRPRQ